MHLYSVMDDEGGRDNTLEGFFATVEGNAAPALETLLSAPETLPTSDRATLSFFLALQTHRTPAAAAQVEQQANTLLQTLVGTESFSDPAAFEKVYAELFGSGKSPEEVEAFRQKLIRDVRAGHLQMVDPDGAAFATGIGIAPNQARLMFGMSWTLLLSADGGFVTSDRGFAMHDPSPVYPWSSQGLCSSADAETTIPLAENACLLLRQVGQPLALQEAQPVDVEVVNLRTYGWADRYIFGQSQEVVTHVRRAAKRRPDRIVRPKPHHQMILFDADPDDDTFARANMRRGWPARVVYEGVAHDYIVFPHGTPVPDVHQRVDAVVEERERKARGLPEGVRPPGRLTTDIPDPRRFIRSG